MVFGVFWFGRDFCLVGYLLIVILVACCLGCGLDLLCGLFVGGSGGFGVQALLVVVLIGLIVLVVSLILVGLWLL